ncbi:MAG: hypothetical protein V4662_11205 [Verrucomicrobiota bacterium]
MRLYLTHILPLEETFFTPRAKRHISTTPLLPRRFLQSRGFKAQRKTATLGSPGTMIMPAKSVLSETQDHPEKSPALLQAVAKQK